MCVQQTDAARVYPLDLCPSSLINGTDWEEMWALIKLFPHAFKKKKMDNFDLTFLYIWLWSLRGCTRSCTIPSQHFSLHDTWSLCFCSSGRNRHGPRTPQRHSTKPPNQINQRERVSFVFLHLCFDSPHPGKKVGHRLTEVKYEAAVCRPAPVEADRVSRKLVAEGETINTQVPVWHLFPASLTGLSFPPAAQRASFT